MATVEWHQTRTGGVTLVELLVTAETKRDVRIESTLRPVWPPRRQGVPTAGWEDGCLTRTVDSGDRLVVGYASPAEPDGQPVTIQTEPPSDGTAGNLDARTLVRALGEAKPPRDLLPETADEQMPADPQLPSAASASPQDSNRDGTTDPSTPIETYFDTVESRLAEAEQLASVESSEAATAAVTAAGGIEAVKQLQAELAADRERLARIAARQRQLSDRLQTVSIPIGALERLV